MDSYLERLRQELEDATAGATAEAMTKSAPEKWSAAQIIEHLFLTYKQTNRGLSKCLQQGSPLATRGTMKDRLASLLTVKFGYIPTGRKSPERAIPTGMLLEDVRRGIAEELQKMDLELNDCERQFGKGTKIMNHPFLGPLTAEEWRKFHLVHGRHHFRQIRERIRS
jgi:hypothetical protein